MYVRMCFRIVVFSQHPVCDLIPSQKALMIELSANPLRAAAAMSKAICGRPLLMLLGKDTETVRERVAGGYCITSLAIARA